MCLPASSLRGFVVQWEWMSRIERICDLLDSAYGKHSMGRDLKSRPIRGGPLDELVLTILSQNTTARNCRQAFRVLSERFPTWDDARTGDEREIARAIHSGGLSQIKAARIKTILQQIYEAQGNLDLSWLARVGSEEARDYLLRFRGVGPKTAACVLLFSLGRPVLPVDTHVHRVSKRLGLIGPKVSAQQAHKILQDMVPAERIYSFHVNMVTHGREVCVAGTPKCPVCVLKGDCDYVGRVRAS